VQFDSRTDQELMRLFRSGREEAFAALVRRHQCALVNFFRRMGVDTDGALDCAQETFLRLLRYRETYRGLVPFKVFLLRLARHARIDWVRRAGRRAARPLESEDCAVPEEAVPAEARLDLEAAVAALPERLREVIVLSVKQGLSYAEIAAVLEVPIGTVKSRAFYAVRALREVLDARREI